MATKQEWLDYLKERKKFSKEYDKNTKSAEKELKKQPDEGEVVVTLDAGGEHPPTPPPNP